MEIVRNARVAPFDALVGFVRVVRSALGAQRGSLFYDLAGLGEDDDPADSKTETRDAQEVYSAVGALARPPKERDSEDRDLLLEALALRTSDGLIPIAFRDPRILKWLNRGGAPAVPKDGQVVFAGYGGSFLSFEITYEDPARTLPTNIVVLYCPYDRDSNGVPQKSHMIMLDPTAGNESVAIVHSSGLAITMTEDEGMVLRGGSGTHMRIQDGKVEVVAPSIVLQGNVALGAAPAAALPLLPGLASPASPSVFVSPT
ncbi:MAG: hypothetical protein ACOY0T_37470 [Myxococcota bacterium]